MNQYDLIIQEYLEEHKSVSFEKIGTLLYAVKNNAEDLPFTPGTIQFEYDKKALTSQGLIDFIGQRLGKSRVLIQSDIESYFELIRQFVNIGKAYEMETIGVFKLAKSNEYEFTPYDHLQKKEESKSGKRQQMRANTNLASNQKTNRSALMFLAVLIILAVLGVVAWGTYNLLFTGSSNSSLPDTPNAAIAQRKPDTNINAKQPKDTFTTVKGDTANYKFIYETTSSGVRAYARTGQLKSYGNLAGVDSTITSNEKVYKLYLKMRLYHADTAKVKDSLQKHLQRNIIIVLFE